MISVVFYCDICRCSGTMLVKK